MGSIYICPSASIDAGMSESRDLNKFLVRMPDGMRDRIAEAAKANGRSMNAEIVHRLELTFGGMPSTPEELTRIIETAFERIERRLGGGIHE